jgi:hypothetical protein
MWKCGLDSSGLGQSSIADSFEHNKLSGSIRGVEFLDQLSDTQRLKKHSPTLIYLCSGLFLISYNIRKYMEISTGSSAYVIVNIEVQECSGTQQKEKPLLSALRRVFWSP